MFCCKYVNLRNTPLIEYLLTLIGDFFNSNTLNLNRFIFSSFSNKKTNYITFYYGYNFYSIPTFKKANVMIVVTKLVLDIFIHCKR